MALKQKIFLERVRKKLTMAVMPTDNLASDKKAIGYVFLEFHEGNRSIIKHSTGYFLLVDFPEGKYNLTVGGDYYQQKDFEVDTSTIQQTMPYMDILLSPNARYPFPERMTVLKGRIVDENYKMITDALITVEDTGESANSEENGDFFINFGSIEKNKNITLNINKAGYEIREVEAYLIKNITTRIGIVQLTKI